MLTVLDIQLIQKCLSNSNFEIPNNILDCLELLKDKGEVEFNFYNINKSAINRLREDKTNRTINDEDYNVAINKIINNISTRVLSLKVKKIKLFIYLEKQEVVLSKFPDYSDDHLVTRYGSKKEEWKPYYNKEDIDTIYNDLNKSYPLEIEYFDEVDCDLDSISENLSMSFLITDFLSLDKSNCGNVELFDDVNSNVFIPVCEDLTKSLEFLNHYRTTKKEVFRRLNKLSDTNYSTPNFYSYTEGIGKLKAQIKKIYSTKYSYEKSIVGYDGRLDGLDNF